MWTLIIWLSWTNPAITVIDNIPTAKDCSRIGDSVKETVNVFQVHYLCTQKEEK